MGKSILSTVLDQALNYIKNNSLKVVACSSQPTTYTEANATYFLAGIVISSSDFTGPAAGDTNGRKITMNQKTGGTVTNSGTATHVAWIDTTNSALIAVTTCTSQALTAGNSITFNSFKDEIADPT